MKTKTSIALLLVTVLFLFSACSTSGPEKTVEAFCIAMQNFDIDAMEALAPSSNETPEGQEENFELSDIPVELLDYLKGNLKEMTYKVGEVKKEGDKATVKVSFVYKDAKEMILQSFKDMFTMSFENIFSLFGKEFDEDSADKMFIDVFNKNKDKIKPIDAKADVTFNCKKIDDSWIIVDMGDDVGNILTSGFLSAMGEAEKLFDF